MGVRDGVRDALADHVPRQGGADTRGGLPGVGDDHVDAGDLQQVAGGLQLLAGRQAAVLGDDRAHVGEGGLGHVDQVVHLRGGLLGAPGVQEAGGQLRFYVDRGQ